MVCLLNYAFLKDFHCPCHHWRPSWCLWSMLQPGLCWFPWSVLLPGTMWVPVIYLCCHPEAVCIIVYVCGLSCHWKPCGSPCSVLPLAVMDKEVPFAVEVMTADSHPSPKVGNHSTKQKTKKTKQPNNKQFETKKMKNTIELILCWPCHRHRVYSEVWLIYLLRLLWRKLSFFFASGYQFQIASWLEMKDCFPFPNQYWCSSCLEPVQATCVCCHSLCASVLLCL